MRTVPFEGGMNNSGSTKSSVWGAHLKKTINPLTTINNNKNMNQKTNQWLQPKQKSSKKVSEQIGKCSKISPWYSVEVSHGRDSGEGYPKHVVKVKSPFPIGDFVAKKRLNHQENANYSRYEIGLPLE